MEFLLYFKWSICTGLVGSGLMRFLVFSFFVIYWNTSTNHPTLPLCFFFFRFFFSLKQAQAFQSLVCTVQVTVEVSIPYGLSTFHFCPWLIWGLWRRWGKTVASKWKLTDVSFITSYIVYHLTTYTSANDMERRQSMTKTFPGFSHAFYTKCLSFIFFLHLS